MFKAIKLLNQKRYENHKIEDNTGKLAINTNDALTIIAEYFKSKFRHVFFLNIAPFQDLPKALNEPITAEEVKKGLVVEKNNNRASGEDGICAELLKYEAKTLDEHLEKKFNETF